MKRTIEEQLKIIKSNCVDLINEEELIKKLEKSISSKTPLKLKIGLDPTAADIHLGHTVILRKLRKLQDLGHIVYFIIGDFTAKIGDPSGRNTARKILSDKEIKYNASTYTNQAFKILDKSKTEIIYNSIWYKDMELNDFLSILSYYTVARVLERDDFSKRLKENLPLTLLEIIYPLIQGYDSVKIKADIEFGGTDQKFNLIVGRHLQETFGQEPQVIITMPLLVGLDGKEKMSKSKNNYIGITEEPHSMFGKIMSISDNLMFEYFRLLTDCDISIIKNMHPKDAKLLLAETLVSYYHSDDLAKNAKEEFIKVFSKKELPTEIDSYKVDTNIVNLIDFLANFKIVSSKNEARRLLNQNAISIIDRDSTLDIKEPTLNIPPSGLILKIGKKKFIKIYSNK